MWWWMNSIEGKKIKWDFSLVHPLKAWDIMRQMQWNEKEETRTITKNPHFLFLNVEQ